MWNRRLRRRADARWRGTPERLDADTRLVRAMCSVIRHRGPDDEGVRVEPGVGLGMRRLSIIDLADGPPADRQRGRRGAGRLQRRDLQLPRAAGRARRRPGTASRPRRDTEVIVHAYEQWGRGVFERLRGMFGIALWDSRARIAAARARPRGHQAAVLRRARRPALLRLGAEVAARGRRRRARDRSRGARALPLVPVHAARPRHLRGRPQAAARAPALLARWAARP